MKIFKFVLLFLISIFNLSIGQPLFINEIMPSNKNIIKDEDGTFSDWIEIYNDSDSSINLSNYTLSDDEKNLNRWHFPDTNIHSKEFILIFASGKNRSVSGKQLHTNFSIKKEGEALFLSENGILVHKVDEIELSDNESYGLYPDGRTYFYRFINPSPGKSNILGQIEDEVIFSRSGGIYKNCFNLSLSCKNQDNQIYYTTDGSIPTTNSFLYKSQLTLDSSLFSNAEITKIKVAPDEYSREPKLLLKAIIIKAAVFKNKTKVSTVETNTYFINELGNIHYDFPIISISAEYRDLFNDTVGIMVPGVNYDPQKPLRTGNYFQRGNDWERPVYIEFYDPKNILCFKQGIGIRTHGGTCRAMNQKAFRFYARSEYGCSNFNYQIFKDLKTNIFKRLVIKPLIVNWSDAGIENNFANCFAEELNVDKTADLPVVVYINGEYWGIYFLQERIDEYFINTYYGINPDSLDIIEDWRGLVNYGDNNEFNILYKFIENNDLSNQDNYNIVANSIDIDNFIDYQILEIFIGNQDWPANNMKCWRERKDGAKWRWIFFDGDAAFKNQHLDSFEQALSLSNSSWPTNAKSTLFLRKLLNNNSFYNKFFQRLEYLLNNQFEYNNICDKYLSLFSFLNQEINNQILRFKIPNYYFEWFNSYYNFYNFILNRPCIMKSQVLVTFNKEISVKSCNITSIEQDYSELEIIQYPGGININYIAKEDEKIQIYLVNVLGERKTLYDGYVPKGANSINTESFNMPNGFYVLNIQGKNSILSKKIIIENDKCSY